MLLTSTTLFAGDLFIVVPWSAAPTNTQERIDGIPDAWPMQTIPADDKTEVPAGTELMSLDQIKERKESLATEYRNYEQRKQTRETAKDTAANNAKVALFDLLDEFAAFEEAWKGGTNYTAAQLQTIVRKHNRALIKLRPIIRDLYRED